MFFSTNFCVKEEVSIVDFSLSELRQTTSPRKKQWRTEGWGIWRLNPPPEIPKAIQNRAKLNPIAKIVKNC